MLNNNIPQLKEHQIAGAVAATDCLRQNKIAYLSFEMRTGKTYTALEIARRLEVKKVLFITVKGGKARSAMKSIERDYNGYKNFFFCTVVNYASLHKISPHLEYDMVIIDEAHKISCSGVPQKQSKVLPIIREFVKDKYCLLLSGTPTPESYSGIYNAFSVSLNSPFAEYKNFFSWAKDFVLIKEIKINRTDSIKDYKTVNMEKIKPYIEKYFFSCTQQEAGISCGIIDKVIKVPMTKELKDLYDLFYKELIVYIDGEACKAVMAADVVTKLHQMASGSVIIKHPINKKISNKILDISKAEYIKEHFGRNHFVVFYMFNNELEMLKQVFGVKLTQDAYEFNRYEKHIYVAQISSSSEGIDLKTAEFIVYYNICYSYKDYVQSKNRMLHLDRKDIATSIFLFSDIPNDISNEIYKIVTSKKRYTTAYFIKSHKKINNLLTSITLRKDNE